MEEIKAEEISKDKSGQSIKLNTETNENKNKNNYISIMTEEETSLWLKNLDLNEEVSKELEKIIKNGKDLIAIYNNNKLLEKLNIDLHSNNIINDAIEEGLEEQLKINILLEKEKNIILNIENEPKFRLKELLSYLEKLLKKSVYLTPSNSPNELLSPNTLIVKKILLNPNKYCNLQLFDQKSIINTDNNPLPDTKNLTYNKLGDINFNINKNKKEIQNLNENKNENLINLNNLNQNNNPNINLVNTNQNTNSNINNLKMPNISKGYASLFQNNKNNLTDFNIDYKMPSQNRPIGNNNYIKLETKNITPSKPLEDFKYHNLLSMKDKEDKEDKNQINEMRFLNDNNNEAKNIEFKNITNSKNEDAEEMENPNPLNKNYFTQRNFNSKTISNDTNNNLMLQQILSKKRSEKNLSENIGKNTIDNLDEDNTNLSFLERDRRERERDSFNLNFINKDNNNEMKKQINNKTENRYEFNRMQDFDKDNIFGNKNLFNFQKGSNPENNDINNLIIKNQNEELKNSKEKFAYNNNNIEEKQSDILKALREKYSMQGNDNKDSENNRINIDFKKDYKPKTPITEERRNINKDNLIFNNISSDDNSNNPLENKFLMRQNEDFPKFNNFLNKNNQQIFQMHQEDDDNNNIMSKFKIDMNLDMNNNNKIRKNRINKPSSGLDFNTFQYKATGYKSSFPKNQENKINQFNQDDE